MDEDSIPFAARELLGSMVSRLLFSFLFVRGQNLFIEANNGGLAGPSMGRAHRDDIRLVIHSFFFAFAHLPPGRVASGRGVPKCETALNKNGPTLAVAPQAS